MDRVLLIGSGGREHALARALLQSPAISKLYVAPGNGGTALIAENVPIAASDLNALVNFAKHEAIDFVVVAPDNPLADGLVDRLEEAGIAAFGPSQAAAELEWSKAFAKRFMKEQGIPTADFEIFDDFEQARTALVNKTYPLVLKADGLALGKGVLICADRTEAEAALLELMQNKRFGEAGRTVLMESCLQGPECSLFAFSDGRTARLMPTARDHKRAWDGDLGPNTGGMGAVSPGADMKAEDLQALQEQIVDRTLQGMREIGRPYIGVLYVGLMLTAEGPKVIEYNARFGDPEAQTLLPLLDSDLYEIFKACRDGRLAEVDIRWKEQASACVVLAAEGYPEHYEKGQLIQGWEDLDPTVQVYHAGTALAADGQVYSNGGRVLSVVAQAECLELALSKVYKEIAKLNMPHGFYRRDIGHGA